MGITGYNYNLSNGSTHSFYTDNSGPSGASGASGSYGANLASGIYQVSGFYGTSGINLASGIYQVSGAHVVSGMSGVGSISNLAFSQIIDMFEKGNLVTDELPSIWYSLAQDVPSNNNMTENMVLTIFIQCVPMITDTKIQCIFITPKNFIFI